MLVIKHRNVRNRNSQHRELRIRNLRTRKLRMHHTDYVVKTKTTPNIRLNDILWESTDCLHTSVKWTCNKYANGTNEETIH